MAKNIVFLIHGVGQHSADWADIPGGPANALRQSAAKYSYFSGRAMDDLVEFVPIRYDDIFDRLLSGWGEATRTIRELCGPIAPFLDEGMVLLSKADSGSMAPAIGGDVLLYKGVRLFRNRVLMRVISEMAKAIAAKTQVAEGTPPSFHVIAHSLGTTVAHDALHELGTEHWPGDPMADERDASTGEEKEAFSAAKATGAFQNGNFRIASLFQISNTSQLLHTTDLSPTESIVRPGQYVQTFFNVDHDFDPISKVGRFTIPQSWGNMSKLLSVRHIYEPNIHAFANYLAHPSIHVHIFKQIFPDFSLTNDERNEARQFPNVNPAIRSEVMNRLRGELDVLLNRGTEQIADEVQALRHWIDVYKGMQSLAEEFKGLI